MLDCYKDSQKEFYSMVTSSISEHGKMSHAYLIDTNGFAEAEQLVMAFAKFLLCNHHYTSLEKCKDCNLCSFIDKKVDQHIQIIGPDEGGLWIKKDQLQGIKEQLSKKSLDNFNQIYIIMEADKLNKSAANSLLKFLEEPDEGIIAILVTDHRYKLLPTIISRCQIYTLQSNTEVVVDDSYHDLFDFVMNIERNEYHTICYIQDLWHNKYKSKEDVIHAFNKLEMMFLDFIHYKIKSQTIFHDFLDETNYVTSHNTEQELVRKLSKIIECRDQIAYNANLSLLMDKFIIEYVGG